MARPENLLEFIDRYGAPDAQYPVIDVTDRHTIVVKCGDKAAVVEFINVAGGDPNNHHLCIDVHPFAGEDYAAARAGVFGMTEGRRIEGFRDGHADGTSLGLPAARLVCVLIGKQGS